MRRALLVPLLALALLAPMTTVVAQGDEADEDEDRRSPTSDGQGRGRGRGGDEPRPYDDDDDGEAEDNRRPDGRAASAIERAARRADPAIGSFNLEPAAREVRGEYVSFSYNETGIQAFRAGNVSLFEIVVLDAEEDDRSRGVVAHGARIRVEQATFTFIAHDNPGAVSRMDAEGTILVRFDRAVRTTLVGDDRAEFVVGNLSGRVRGDDLRLDTDGVLSSSEDLLLFLDAPRAAFDLHREDIGRAIGKGHVGAEMSLNRRGESLDEDVVSYGNVTLTKVRAEPGNLTLLIDGHGMEGRVVVLNVDGSIVRAERHEDLQILFDNETIGPADDLADVLDPDNDGLKPEYHVVFDPQSDSFQLLVSVPHYSVHVLSVTTPIVLPPPSVMVGLVAGLAVLVPSAYALFRRKD